MVVVQCPIMMDTSSPVPYHERILDNFNAFPPTKVCLIDGETEKSYTFKDVKVMAYTVAHQLRKEGFQKGDVLAIFIENRPEWLMVMLGVSSLGGVVTGINPAYTTQELSKQLYDCNPKYIITSKELMYKVVETGYSNKFSRIYIHDGCKDIGPVRPLQHILHSHEDKAVLGFADVAIDVHNDTFLLPYSSGTTGIPKGVMLTHANLNLCLISGGRNSLFSLTQDNDTVVIILPYFHMAGFMTQSWAVMHGNLSIVLPKFDTATYCQLVQKYRATACMVVPTILVFLAKSALVDQYDLSSIKSIGFGAAPAGKEIINALLKRFPNIKRLAQAYGMTESGGLATTTPSMPLESFPIRSCGPPLPGYQMKVVGLKDGKELGPMEEGEICMKSSGIMKGYLNKPEATKETVDEGGWLHSGDVGYFDHFGYFYIVDRVKELVKYKGFQVAPAELEDLILRHDAVEEVAVTGIPDSINPDIGELPTAFVVLTNNICKPTSQIIQEIQNLVKEHCADYKHLRGGVILVQSLPKSGSGKVLRRHLRQMNLTKNSKL